MVLLKRTDDYAFSALALKCNVYKNPSLIFDDEVITDAIVDGPGDGGADILINDPNSDTYDLMICQSQFYEVISYDEIAGSINKIIIFYKDMKVGKLCMSSVFQLPCTSRNKTKIIFKDRFYNVIFKDNRKECASIVKEMLYPDYYFRKKFIKV